MMALRDSERVSLGKHYNTIVASFLFVYLFPFTHFSCRLISFCTQNYVTPLPVNFVSSNTLPIIRHSAFPGVAEYFSSGESYFIFLKKNKQKTPKTMKTFSQKMAPGVCTFLISGNVCSQISYFFPKLFSQAFPEDRLSDKMLTLAFSLSSAQGIILLLLFLKFLSLGFAESTFAST